MAPQRWLPIESNPEVMNQFLHESGLPKSWCIHDVFGLDESLLAMLPSPVLAVLLLFPINEKTVEHYKTFTLPKNDDLPEDLYYMKQTISNACGTVALIHAVANNQDRVILNDGPLKRFLEATKDAGPEERAAKLEGDDDICETHDAVAQEGQTAAPDLEDSVDYHFIAFVEKEGKIYELDGRKPGPMDCGKVEGSFLSSAAAQCKKYMSADPDNINFTIVALAAAE